MTQEDIIHMARISGVRDDGHRFEFSEYKYLERFAALAFEQGRQEGMKQERALWELSKLGQEIEAQPPLLVQRQPLTDEQIRQCFRDLYEKKENWLAYARAIEAAHNIGAKP